MNYKNEVYVFVKDDVSDDLVEDISENSLEFLKSKNAINFRDEENRVLSNKYKEPKFLLRSTPYIERLYQESLQDINEYDKMIVKEAFKREIYFSKIKKPTLFSMIKKYFKKK